MDMNHISYSYPTPKISYFASSNQSRLLFRLEISTFEKTQTTSYQYSLLLSGNVSRLMRFNIPAGYGLLFHRNFSKVPSDIDSGDLNGMIGAVRDKAVEAAPVVNEVAIAAADSSAPVAVFQYLIDTGFQWWASIAATTLLIRFIMLPIRIQMTKYPFSAYMKTLDEPLQTKLKELKSRNEPFDRKEVKAMLLSHLVKKLRELPVRYLLPITTTGILFFAISNMAVKVPSFVTGGTLWFMDLTTPDHSMRLPILLALTLWLRFQAIYCSWITSNLFSMASSIVLMDPRVLELLRISLEPPSAPK